MKKVRTFTKRMMLLPSLMALGIGFFATVASAEVINIDMEGSAATIPKGNTVTRRLFGIPKIGGTMTLKFKWHAVNIIPNSFNPLNIEIVHGTSVINRRTSCFSTHSNKTPKCDVSFTVSQEEAERDGAWQLKITNNSNDEVISFDIQKGSDINPAVPRFNSTYNSVCPSAQKIDMEGTTLTLTKGSTQERRISRIGNGTGTLDIRLKWNAVSPIPAFPALRVELMNGSSVVQSSECHSIHSPLGAKCSFKLETGNRPANQWKLRFTNNSNHEVVGINIEKESGEINPLIPRFESTFKLKCP